MPISPTPILTLLPLLSDAAAYLFIRLCRRCLLLLRHGFRFITILLLMPPLPMMLRRFSLRCRLRHLLLIFTLTLYAAAYASATMPLRDYYEMIFRRR